MLSTSLYSRRSPRHFQIHYSKPWPAVARWWPRERGGNPEIVGEGVDLTQPDARGMLFPPGDAVALEEALRKLLADSDLRARLGAAAAAFVHAELSLDASALRMGEIYRNAMSRPGR